MAFLRDNVSPRSQLLALQSSPKRADFSPRHNAAQRRTAAPNVGMYQAQHKASDRRATVAAPLHPRDIQQQQQQQQEIYVDLDLVPRGAGVLPSTIKPSRAPSSAPTTPPFGGVAAQQTPPFGGVANKSPLRHSPQRRSPRSAPTSPTYQPLELKAGSKSGLMSKSSTNLVVDDLLNVIFYLFI